jgi:hypothetical protein
MMNVQLLLQLPWGDRSGLGITMGSSSRVLLLAGIVPRAPNMCQAALHKTPLFGFEAV